MNKKTLKLLGIMFSSLAIVLSSCGNNDNPSSSEPEGEDIFDPIDLGEGKDISMSEEELYYHSNQDYDVDPSYRVKVAIQEHLKGDALSYNSLRNDLLDNVNNEDLITIKDHHGNSFAPSIKSCTDEEGKEYFEISPTSDTYREGSIITASLHNEQLCFKDKDPEFDDLYF